MSEPKATGTDPLLLQIVGTLAEMKQAQQTQGEMLSRIQEDIRQFDVKITGLQHDMAQAKSDIENRTHKEDTKRLREEISNVQNEVKTKASNKMMWWVLSLVTAIFLAAGAAVVRTALI